MDWDEIQTYTSHADVFVADGGGKSVYTDVDWCNDSALVIGGEADGVSDVARGLGNMVKVFMAAGVESMNAAVAGAAMLFEARRQRLVSEPKVYRDG